MRLCGNTSGNERRGSQSNERDRSTQFLHGRKFIPQGDLVCRQLPLVRGRKPLHTPAIHGTFVATRRRHTRGEGAWRKSGSRKKNAEHHGC
jgi:hypothetical protein